MRDIKVSVVIPVFNTEEYVRQSIYSIINQTLKDIEIIIVNDGSTDSSLSVVEDIARSDHRINVVSTPNNGLSIARNIGLYHANGKYIYFFDSDDILKSNTLEECYNKSECSNLDFVFFDADSFSDENIDVSKFSYNRVYLFNKEVYTGPEILELQLRRNGYRSSACLNFIKKEFLYDKNLFFYPQTIHEDELFTFLLYLNASRVSFIPESFFCRRLRSNSIMTKSYSIKNADGCITVCRELLSYSRKGDVSRLQKKLIIKRINTILLTTYNSIVKNLKNRQKYYRNIIYKEFHSIIGLKLLVYMEFRPVYNFLKKVTVK